MKKYLISFLSLAILLTSCAASRNADTSSSQALESDTKTPSGATEHQVIFEDIAEGDSLFASMKKSYCYGTCPVFEMRIYNSGVVQFDGKANVQMLGLHTTILRLEDMALFIDKANEIKYFEMDDDYDNPGITDLPSTTTSIVINGKRKTVRRRVNFPAEIKGYEQLFLDLMESKSWIQERGN